VAAPQIFRAILAVVWLVLLVVWVLWLVVVLWLSWWVLRLAAMGEPDGTVYWDVLVSTAVYSAFPVADQDGKTVGASGPHRLARGTGPLAVGDALKALELRVDASGRQWMRHAAGWSALHDAGGGVGIRQRMAEGFTMLTADLVVAAGAKPGSKMLAFGCAFEVPQGLKPGDAFRVSYPGRAPAPAAAAAAASALAGGGGPSGVAPLGRAGLRLSKTLLALSAAAAVLALLLPAAWEQAAALRRPLGAHLPHAGALPERAGLPEPRDFYENYVRKDRAGVFRGGGGGLLRLGADLSDEGLLRRHPSMELDSEHGRKEHRGMDTARWTLREWLARYRTVDEYVVSDLMSPPAAELDRQSRRYSTFEGEEEEGPLSDDFALPACFRCGGLHRLIANVNLWWSGGGTSSVLHNDGSDNLNCVINGSKRFVFIDRKYKGEIEEGGGWLFEGMFSAADTDAVDCWRFPALCSLPVRTATVRAGDCLFIPKRLYHSVISDGGEERKSLAINIWFHRHEWDPNAACVPFFFEGRLRAGSPHSDGLPWTKRHEEMTQVRSMLGENDPLSPGTIHNAETLMLAVQKHGRLYYDEFCYLFDRRGTPLDMLAKGFSSLLDLDGDSAVDEWEARRFQAAAERVDALAPLEGDAEMLGFLGALAPADAVGERSGRLERLLPWQDRRKLTPSLGALLGKDAWVPSHVSGNFATSVRHGTPLTLGAAVDLRRFLAREAVGLAQQLSARAAELAKYVRANTGLKYLRLKTDEGDDATMSPAAWAEQRRARKQQELRRAQRQADAANLGSLWRWLGPWWERLALHWAAPSMPEHSDPHGKGLSIWMVILGPLLLFGAFMCCIETADGVGSAVEQRQRHVAKKED